MEYNKIRALRADEIECRVQTVTEKSIFLLLYKDARCDMNILDEMFSPFGWQREHFEVKGNLFCKVGIKDEQGGEWIWKSDAGAPSNQEAEKGHASDAFKRACFNWGIGRELYTAPSIRLNVGKNEIIKDDIASGKRNRPVHRLNYGVAFRVANIGYTEGKITSLTIVDQKGLPRFELKDGKTINHRIEQQGGAAVQQAPPPSQPATSKARQLLYKAKNNKDLVIETLGAFGYEKADDIPDDIFPQVVAELELKAS